MRLKYLMCNLKSNKTLKEILAYKHSLQQLKREDIEFVLFPTSLYLSFFYDVPYKIGSQNISVYKEGSYTGEVLARQLKSLKVSYVFINHFEANEKQKEVIEKIKRATEEHIKVVLCIGEKEKQTMDETIVELKKELKKILSKLTKEELNNILFAYEPFWMINTTNIIKPEVISNIVKNLKKELEKAYQILPIFLYGGGINNTNIQDLVKIENIDGYLLGNCANNPDNVLNILNKI